MPKISTNEDTDNKLNSSKTSSSNRSSNSDISKYDAMKNAYNAGTYGWTYMPSEDVYSPTWNEVHTFNNAIPDLIRMTIENGGKLSNSQVWNYLSEIYDSSGYTDYETMYNEWYNQNRDTLFNDDTIAAYKAAQTKREVNALADAIEFNPITQELNSMGLNVDYARQLEALNQSTSAQYEASMNELARAENDMYRSIGMSQMQYERDIAKRRQQALKSGMSTAQLAAQEQANILAAQTGATQIAQNYMNQRYNTINSFAGKGAQNYAQVLANQINWNQNIATQNAANQVNYNSALMNLYGQTYAADKQLESTKYSMDN